MAAKIFYRVPDLIELTGFSEPVIRHLLATGAIPSRRLGRRVVILPEELKASLRRLPRPGDDLEESPS